MRIILINFTALLFIIFIQTTSFTAEKVVLLCGAAFKKPIEEVILSFVNKTKIEVNVSYSSAGAFFSQILFTKKGDIFIAPSPDHMEKAREKGVIYPDSTAGFGYMVPVINVQKGNPKKINGLEDLMRQGIRIAIGNPRTVFVGVLAVEIIERKLNPEQKKLLKKNIVVYTEDFSKLSFLLQIKQVDAIIGFHYLAEWFPDKIENIRLKPDEIFRIGSGQAAILSFSKNVNASQRLIDFLLSVEGQRIFKKYYYFSTKEEVDSWLGAEKPVGGTYIVPEEWFGH